MEKTRRAAIAAVVLHVVVLIGGFALSTSDSEPREMTFGSGVLGTAAACRELSRTTLTSTPLSTSADLNDPRYDELVKFYGTAAVQVADKAAPGPTRNLLLSYAAAARTKKWTSASEWLSDPAQRRLQTRCAPYTSRRAP